MYATVGTRLIASIPAAFANPAALPRSGSPTAAAPFSRSRSSAWLARSTFPTLAVGGCISTMTGNSASGRAVIMVWSAGSIFSGAFVSAREGGSIGTRARAIRASAQLKPISRILMRIAPRRDQ